MELLIGAFVLGMATLAIVAEDERIEDYADRMAVNRMADKSRAGWGKRRAARWYGKGAKRA